MNVVDLDEKRINAWNAKSEASLPIHEKGLWEIVSRRRGKNLHFSTNVTEAIKAADLILICVNTPTKEYGKGEGMASDMSIFEQAVRMIADNSEGYKIIVEKSTVPCKTSEMIERTLRIRNSSLKFDILSNPEFLAEGTAINDLIYPDRVLIGGKENENGSNAVEVLVNIYARWVPREKIITSNLWSAELAKISANAFLAQRISSINSLSALCEKTGADVQQISAIIGKDSRIGDKFLKASVGFGGSCFQKDILNLVYLCKTQELHEVAEYWLQVIKMNDYQKNRFASNIIHKLNGTISKKKIAIFGFAFKKDTADTRESPAIQIISELAKEGGKISIFDPQVASNQIIQDLSTLINEDKMKNISVAKDPHAAVLDAEAIAVITEWDEFKRLDYEDIFKKMVKPAFIFDGRLLLVDLAEKLSAIGFHVEFVGKPSQFK